MQPPVTGARDREDRLDVDWFRMLTGDFTL